MDDETVAEAPTALAGATAVLIAMCLGLMLSMFTSTMVNVALPAIGANLGASPTQLQWVVTVYTLVYGSLLLVGGALGNRLGRRGAFLAGTVVFVVGSVACALAPTAGLLLGARVLQAIGVAALLPQTLAVLVHEYVDPIARARAVGIWAGVASLGLAAGPVLGGIVVEWFGWRAGFVLSAALGLVALGLAWAKLPVTRHGRPPTNVRLDVAGAALGTATLAALVFGLTEGRDLGWASVVTLGSFALAVVAGAAFVVGQRRKDRLGGNPLMPGAIWRPAFVAADLAGLAYFFAFFGVLYLFSLELQQQRGLSAIVAGLAFLPMTLLMAILAPVAGRLSGRFGTRPVLLVGLVVTAVGAGLLALLNRDSSTADVVWRLGLVGIGSGLMSSPMSNQAVSSVDVAHSITASAVHNTFRQIGSTLGVTVLGAVAQAAPVLSGGVRVAMVAVAAVLVSTAVAVALLTRRMAAG